MIKACVAFLLIPLASLAQEHESVDILTESDMFNSSIQGEFIEVPVSAPGGPTVVSALVIEDGRAILQGDIIMGKAASLLSRPTAAPFGVGTNNPQALSLIHI